MDNKQLGPAEVVIVAGGAIAFIASFLPWVKIGDVSESAWSDSFLPLLTWVGIFGAVMAAQVLLRTFATVNLPERILGFSWNDLHLILGFYAALTAVSFLIVADNKSYGFWLSLIGAIAMVVGAWMQRSEAPSNL